MEAECSRTTWCRIPEGSILYVLELRGDPCNAIPCLFLLRQYRTPGEHKLFKNVPPTSKF